MSPASQHQLVVFGASAGALLCIYLLVTVVRSRSKKQVETEHDDLAERIQERLDTGRFSRRASAVRRKAVDVPKDTEPPTPLQKEASGEDDLNITRQS